MDLSHLPWYVKAFLALGGGGLVWKFIQGHIPAIFERLTPVVLKLVDSAMAVAFVHPVVRWFVFGNKANVEAMLTAFCDGLEKLVDAIEKRMIANIESQAAREQPAGVPPAGTPAA